MRKQILFLLIVVLTITGAYIAYTCRPRHGSEPDNSVPMPPGSGAPQRMSALGPVGTGIDSTEILGEIQIQISADRLWFKKTKTFGFDNALNKAMAAKNFKLTISKAGRQLISLHKQKIEMPLEQNRITMDRPEVLFPKDLGLPDAIQLDKSNKLLHIRHGNNITTWELSKM